MSELRNEQLVEDASEMVLIRCQPGNSFLHHSDRDSQYTSRLYRGVLDHYGFELKVRGKGNCWDNAVMEKFFGISKAECTNRRSFASWQKVKSVIFEYMEVFYNRQKLHSSLGHGSSESFENRHKQIYSSFDTPLNWYKLSNN